MPNLYGVANPIPQLTYTALIGGVNINCPAGAETNIIAVPVTALDHGIYYIIVWLNLCISVQATPPTSLVVGVRINNGADLYNYAVNMGPLTANSFPQVNVLFVTSAPTTAFWPPSGSTIQITFNPAAQAVIAQNANTQAIIGILRGPDQ